MTFALDRLKTLASEEEAPKIEEEKLTLPTSERLKSLSEEEKQLPPKGQRIAEQVGRKWLANVLTSPKHLADFLKFGAESLSGMGEELAAKEGRLQSPEELAYTQNVVKALGFPSSFLEENVPGYQPENVEKKIIDLQKKTGMKPSPLEPASPEEELFGGLAASSGAAAPFGPAAMLWAPATELASKGLEKLGIGKAGQFIGSMSLPVVVDFINAIRTRRYIPQQGERAELYNRSRALGMTDEELMPILATESQVGTTGRLAGGARRTEEALEQSNQALGNLRERIFQRGQQFGTIPQNIANDLITDFQRVRNNLSQTLQMAPREETLVNFIDNAVNRLQSGTATTNDLMGFRRSLNRIEGGRNALGQLRPGMERALSRIDPQLSRDFNDYNRLYQFYSTNLERINPDMFRNLLGASEAGKIIESVATGQPLKAAVRALTVPVLSQLASRVITDPVLQSIHRNFARALRSNNRQVARGAYQQLQKYVDKNFPEESEKIEWPDFD